MEAEVLQRLYYQMLRIRLVEEAIGELYPQQEMRCPVHLSIGQEAIPAGVCAHLSSRDYILSGHRSHGHYLAKGGNLKAMMAELYGKEAGCSLGKGGSMHLVDLEAGFLGATPIVASTIPIAVGVAFGSLMEGRDAVTVVFFGDGAVEEGTFHESLNFATLKRLPVIFVCENNLYSVYSPLSVRQPRGREIVHLAQGHGVESYQGDGNDVREVYGLARQAVLKARGGGGPTFLEFSTYRWREHVGPNYDNDLGYRSEEEYALWRARCPLEQLEAQLLSQAILDREAIKAMRDQVHAEVGEAVALAKTLPYPPPELLLQHVYAP